MKLRTPVLALAVFAFAGISCQKTAAPPPSAGAPPAVPVTVVTAAKLDVPTLLRTIGSVEAKALVVIRPQVAGRVNELPIPEGSDVKEGDVLVRLDPRPYQAALAQAEANVRRSTAMAEDAHRLAERTGNPAVSAAISQRETESARAQAAAADAEIAASTALVESARLNLLYCTITAPFSGRIGAFLVKQGSIVKENETDLVEIGQVDPIEVSFALPEENLPAIRAAMARSPLEVDAAPSGDGAEPAKGMLTFVDNRVDPATGTIRLKATFENKDRRLWPGQFANVTLSLGSEKDAIVVPEVAVQQTQSGAAVFVVKPDSTVELRPISLRRVMGNRVIVLQGVSEGESVVTEGQLRLGPGTKVQPKLPAEAAATPAPAKTS